MDMASGFQHKKYSVPNASSSKGYVNYGANSSGTINNIKSNSLPANASLLHLQCDPQTIEPDIDSLFSTNIQLSKSRDSSKSPLKTLEQAFLSLKNPDKLKSKDSSRSPLKERRKSKNKDQSRSSLDGCEQDCEALLSIETSQDCFNDKSLVLDSNEFYRKLSKEQILTEDVQNSIEKHSANADCDSKNVRELFAIKNCSKGVTRNHSIKKSDFHSNKYNSADRPHTKNISKASHKSKVLPLPASEQDFFSKTNIDHLKTNELYRMPCQNFEPDLVFSKPKLKDIQKSPQKSSSSDDFETPLLLDETSCSKYSVLTPDDVKNDFDFFKEPKQIITSPRKLSKISSKIQLEKEALLTNQDQIIESTRPPSGKNSVKQTKNAKTNSESKFMKCDSKNSQKLDLKSSFRSKSDKSNSKCELNSNAKKLLSTSNNSKNEQKFSKIESIETKFSKPSKSDSKNLKSYKTNFKIKSDLKNLKNDSKISKSDTKFSKTESKISSKLDLKSTFLKTDLKYKKCGLSEDETLKKESSVNYQKDSQVQNNCDYKSSENLENEKIQFLEISPQVFAEQITLLDLPAFTAIQAEEFTSCAWNSRNKLNVAPNVVAFTRRFNNVSFWTVSEILCGETPRKRAEHISHFIRIARHLHSLNNLHALFAVISGLQSASIHRLDKSWTFVQKKDKLSFEKLASIFSEKENWKILREYQDSLRLPCIPYLGLFLTDFVYIDMSQPANQRSRKMDNILRVISLYQQSRYDELKIDEPIQKYLEKVKYIEELQRFLEDDQYKLSLKLEPPVTNNIQQHKKLTDSTDSNIDAKVSSDLQKSSQLSNSTIQEQTRNMASLNLSPAKVKGKVNYNSPNPTTTSGSLRISNPVAKFIPGHRKCRSLGTNIFYKTNQQVQPSLNPNGCDESSNASSEAIEHYNSRHLLDDSVIENLNHKPIKTEMQARMCESLERNFNPSNMNGKYWGSSGLSSSSSKNSNIYYGDITAIHEGFVRRKLVLRDHRKTPLVTQWQRYWLQLSVDSLNYYAPKSFKGNERADFKREPQKTRSLMGWCVNDSQSTNNDETSDDVAFELNNRTEGKAYKFKCSTVRDCHEWREKLKRQIEILKNQHENVVEDVLPANLMSFE